MNIVYCLTKDFIEKTIPSMKSVLEFNPKAKIYLLTEVDSVDIGIPVNVVNISNRHEFDNSVNIRNNFGGYINLLKVLYPDILKLKKIIHLDADTIVCDSLENLWKTNITGKWVAAVPEYRGRYNPFSGQYFNMGVALINLEQMRKDNIVPEMVRYLNDVRQPFADQDAWVKYCLENDKFVPVDVRYNENFATGETDNPAIVHYCGRFDWWDNPRIKRGEYLAKYKGEVSR